MTPPGKPGERHGRQGGEETGFHVSVLSFIYYVDAKCSESSGKGIFRMECFSKTETGGDGTDDRYERVVYGHLSNRIQTEQFVVECKSDGRDGNEQQQAHDAEYINLGQSAAKGQPGND